MALKPHATREANVTLLGQTRQRRRGTLSLDVQAWAQPALGWPAGQSRTGRPERLVTIVPAMLQRRSALAALAMPSFISG